jgi:hypothetical protein
LPLELARLPLELVRRVAVRFAVLVRELDDLA